jgi:hypothetical protein
MIRLESIGKQNGKQIVFIEASAGLQRGEKVGLVGPNLLLACSAARRSGSSVPMARARRRCSG